MPQFDLWSLLLAFGFFQALVLLVVLQLRFGGSQPANFLSVLVLAIAMPVFNFLLMDSGLYKTLPHLIGVGVPFMFLSGPAYWLYLRCLVEKKPKLRVRDSLHLLPFLLAFIADGSFYLSPAEHKIAAVSLYLDENTARIAPALLVLLALQVLQTIIYLWFGMLLIKAWSMRLSNAQYQWLSGFNKAYLLLVLAGFIWINLLSLFQRYSHEADYLLSLIYSTLINALLFVALGWHSDFKKLLLASTTPKYERSSLSESASKSLIVKVLEHMESKSPHLNPNLRLSDLANELGLSTNQLSQLLNQELDKNFYEFVNGYRLEAVKEKLRNGEDRHMTLFGIAMECGFNSKNTFNRLFKQSTGYTPSSYAKSFQNMREEV